jgi:hypothetical protein
LIISLSESDVDQRTEEIDNVSCKKLDLNIAVVFSLVSIVFLVVEKDNAPFHDESNKFNVERIHNSLPV